jgi:subtilisin family serine protease
VSVLSTIALGVAVTGLAVIPGGSPVGASPAGASPPRPDTAGTWVTLITGDRVLVRGSGVIIDPAARPGPVPFEQYTRHGDRYVLPADAGALVSAGKLDRELFNVTGLVRQGYDDAHAPAVPLLVRYGKGRLSAAAPAGARVRRMLPQVGIQALDEAKSTAPRFWLQNFPGGKALAGAERVWLNGKVHPTLDQSVPQIGAPTAWAAGLTGAGQTVAVLDTGIDTHHPDFAGRIGATRDFTDSGSVEDHIGHGTHVASIVAGSAAASGGKYKGVAPDATLAIGKVFDDDGNGTVDEALAGMQWAAQSGARVVNMSLGIGPTDGTDPMSLAVNELTQQFGTLFVVAAGNDGGDGTVSAPASADDALAVGSVSKTDVLSPFSSRGPRLGDGAVKPDVAAPGEDIAAAQASGAPPLGEPVGDSYQRLSGTSMASPHVAGSAALLAQQHPDWRAAELKAALTSTATAIDGAGPFAVGSGRVDVARAVTQPVTATGSASMFLPWPNRGGTRQQTVTWRNTGKTAVTLSLAASLDNAGAPAPTGLLTLSASTVTVPAGDTAAATLTAAAQDGKPGRYTGVLIGHSADGSMVTRTALSVYQEEEKFALSVTTIDRNGAVGGCPEFFNCVSVYDLDHIDRQYFPEPGQPLRLPRGRYVITSILETPLAGQNPSTSLVTHPELLLDRDTAVRLDARDGRPVSTGVPDDPAVKAGQQSLALLSKVTDCGCTLRFEFTVPAEFYQLYAATVPGTSSPNFAAAVTRLAEEPRLDFQVTGDRPYHVQAGWVRGSVVPVGTADLTAVYAGHASADELATVDAAGKLVVFVLSINASLEELNAVVDRIKAAGGRVAMAIPDDLVASDDLAATVLSRTAADIPAPALPTLFGQGGTGARFLAQVQAGPTAVSYVSRLYPDKRYELFSGAQGKVDAGFVYRPRIRDLVPVRSAYYGADDDHFLSSMVSFFGADSIGDDFTTVRPASARTEYFSPGDWELSDSAPTPGTDSITIHPSLRAGHPARIDWNKAPVGPSFADRPGIFVSFTPRPWALRQGGALDVILPLYGDAAGNPRVAFRTGTISLYRNGTLVGTEPSLVQARFAVPDAAANYRLTASGPQVSNADRRLWPAVSAAWTFRSSAAAEGKQLPLLSVRFDPALDLRNRAPGGRPFTFPAYVDRQDAGQVPARALSVQVSYDDGTTWRPAKVVRAGDHWAVTVNHPAAGFVSLRASATDAAGNTVEQTVLRGYEIAELR